MPLSMRVLATLSSLPALLFLLAGCGDGGVECGPSTVLADDICVSQCADGQVLRDGECVAGTECGPGTVLSDGNCVPECGEGTVYLDGECVPDTECGPGTLLVDGECVPECGEGTVLVDGECVPETECGPGTVLVDGECIPNDGVGPAPVTDLAIGTDGSDLLVSWTNPTDEDFGGVLVVRQARVPVFVDGTPNQFLAYDIGDEVEGVEVVHVSESDATSFADTTALLGMRYSYAAFAFDAARNYSTATTVIGVEPLPVQIAQIEISDPAGTPTASISIAPSDMGLTVGDVSLAAGTLSLTVHVTNNFDVAVVAPKVLLTGTNQGTASNPAGALGGNPYWRFDGAYGSPGSGEPDMQQSLLAIAQGAEASRVVTIDGIDGTVDPLVVDIRLGRAPVVGFSLHDYDDADAIIAQFYDQSTHSFVPTLPKSAGSSNSGDYHRSACGSAIISADNRWFYCGSSHSASVKIYDMAQMGASLAPTIVEVPIHRDPTVDTLEELSIVEDTTALVRGLALSPDDQTLYASVGYSGYGGDLDADRADGLDVIRIDVSDPTAPVADTAARVVLDNTDSEASSFGLALSPNGKQLAVGGFALSTVHFIDTASMTQIDTDASLPGTQPLDLGAGREPMQMVWRGNGSLVVADDGWSQHRLVAVDVQGGYAMEVFYEAAGSTPTALHFDADGRLWELLRRRRDLASVLWVHEYVPGILPQGNQTVSSPVSFLRAGEEAGNGLGLWLSSDHGRVIGATDGNNAVAREFGVDDLAAIPGLSEAAAPYVWGGQDGDYGHWTTGTSL